MSELIFTIVTFGYLLVGIFYIIDMVLYKFKNDKIRMIILAGVFLLHLAGLIVRWVESGHSPLSNMYESLSFYAWTIILISFYLKYKFNLKSLVGVSALLAFITIGAASLLPSEYKAIKPLMPALQSYWLVIHVVTCFIGYAAFAVAFGSSTMYLVKESLMKKKNKFAAKIPDLNKLDDVTYNQIAIGFSFLTLGILTGAVWAKYAWGDYWSWDPKETWALVTWLVYAVYLHSRRLKNWQGTRSHWLSVIGFIAVLFTYVGVNFILSGLHSYA